MTVLELIQDPTILAQERLEVLVQEGFLPSEVKDYLTSNSVFVDEIRKRRKENEERRKREHLAQFGA